MGKIEFIIQSGLENQHYKIFVVGTRGENYIHKQFIPFPVKTGDVVRLTFREGKGKYFKCEKVKPTRKLKDKAKQVVKVLEKQEIKNV